MTATPQEIMAKSVCLVLSFARIGSKRSVASNEVKVSATEATKALDQSMVHVGKDLFDSPQLRAIVTHDSVTRKWVVSRSVPSPLFRNSVYLLSVDAVEEVCEHLEERREDRAKLEEEFVAAWLGLVREAKWRLGPLFDPSEYPTVNALRDALKMEWSLIEWGTPEKKLRTISKAMFEKERAKAEAMWANAAVQIEDALVAGMSEVFSHLADVLSGGEDGKPKKFKQASVSKVEEFLELLAKRNLTGRKDLDELAEKGRRLLTGVDAKDLKSDDKLRARVVKGVGEIKSSLGEMLEARPARKITLTDEEV